MKKKVYVVGTVGLPACYGGFETLVENLVDKSSPNIEYTVFCSKPHYSVALTAFKNAKLIYLPFKANGIQSVIYDMLSLMVCLFHKPDSILILGVSGGIFLPILKAFSNSRIIVNIDGLEWRRQKWGRAAKAFLKLSEVLAVRFSHNVISDNQAIQDYILSEYGASSDVIAYGGDHAVKERTPNVVENYALGLCRVEPENNVHLILEAFSGTSFPIRFVGNWNNSDYGRSLKKKYSACHNIDLIDPIYDAKSLAALRDKCCVYVHGHSAGGTNPSLVEMMFFAKPILAFDCSFNRYTTENRALYFDSVSSLQDMLESWPDIYDVEKLGSEMCSIAQNRYTWSKIAKSYESLY